MSEGEAPVIVAARSAAALLQGVAQRWEDLDDDQLSEKIGAYRSAIVAIGQQLEMLGGNPRLAPAEPAARQVTSMKMPHFPEIPQRQRVDSIKPLLMYTFLLWL